MSFLASATSSSCVCGGFSGSRPRLEHVLVVVERDRVGRLRHAVELASPVADFSGPGKYLGLDDRRLGDHVGQVEECLAGGEHRMVRIVDGDDIGRLAGRERASTH